MREDELGFSWLDWDRISLLSRGVSSGDDRICELDWISTELDTTGVSSNEGVKLGMGVCSVGLEATTEVGLILMSRIWSN